MQNQTNLEKLNTKVSQILQQFHAMKAENDMLRTEIITLKSQKELTNQELEKLIHENSQKDAEIEEIANKIESIIG
ncbi:MAG: hypothetical protein L3I99_07775 [Sulfurimonas sp.]|nr:hypothetical protein [Sulfurimonas sp.]